MIFAFNESLIKAAVSHIHQIPWIGPKLEAPFKELLTKQKEKLHRKTENVADHVSLSRSISIEHSIKVPLLIERNNF